MVSRTRLNLRRLYLYLVLVFTFVFNLLNKLHTILRIIDVFHWVYKPSILTSLFKFSKSFAREGKSFTPFTFLVAKPLSLLCLVWLNFCLPFSGPCSQDFLAFMPLQEFEVHFEIGKNLWLTFKNAFVFFFLALQQVTMALKTLLNDIVENFVNRC